MSTFKDASILRDPHNEENPYLQVSKKLIRDKSISPECRWLIIYILCNVDKWEIKAKQIINHLKGIKGYKRDNIYKLFNEAIEAGYMKRETYINEKGLERIRYFISESPKFKKCLPRPEIPYAEIPYTEIPHSKELISSSYEEVKEEENIKNIPEAQLPHSADAENLYSFFLKKIKEKDEGFGVHSKKVKDKWINSLRLLLQRDKRSVQEIMDLNEWAWTHHFFKKNCMSPMKFREFFSEMLIQRNSEKEKYLIQQNRMTAIKAKEKYPKELRELSFDDKFVYNRKKCKEISLNLPEEQFIEYLKNLFSE